MVYSCVRTSLDVVAKESKEKKEQVNIVVEKLMFATDIKKIQIIKKIKHHKKVSFQKLPQKATRKSAKYFKNKGCKCHLNRKCRIIRK